MTRQRGHAWCGTIIAVLIALLPATVGPQSALAQGAGLVEETAYESPQFGYTVEWDDSWQTRERDATSNAGGFDSLTIRGNDAALRVTGRAAELPAAEFLQDSADLLLRGSVSSAVLAENPDAPVPYIFGRAGDDRFVLEAYDLPENDAIVVVALIAPVESIGDALAAVQETVIFNGDGLYVGAVADAVNAGDTAAAAPADADEPDAAVEQPPAAESTPAPDSEATPEPGLEDPGLDENVYTSPTYGFELIWSEPDWDATATSEGGYDVLELTGGYGSATIWAGNEYGGDPAACLEGEAAYYAEEDPAIADWAPAENDDGDPIAGTTRSSAYGVFTFTYTDPADDDAESTELVDYIECRQLVEGEAVLVVIATARPDVYNEHIDQVLSITNAVSIADDEATETDESTTDEDVAAPATPDGIDEATPEASPAATPEASPVATPGASPEVQTFQTDAETSAVEDRVFSSPEFGIVLPIPEGWQIEDESLASDDESLTLTNGVSEITVRATTDRVRDLDDCVTSTAEEQAETRRYRTLELSETADGDPFAGSDRTASYGNYTYTYLGDDHTFFIDCRHIDEGESVLIVTQDVPLEDYATQRRARRAIQDAIVFED